MAAVQEIASIFSLAKAGYESCLAVKECKKQAARIAERLSWVMRRTDKWQHICTNGSRDTFDRLHKALTNVNLALEAAGWEKKNWRERIWTFVGAKGVVESVLQAERELSDVLQDLRFDIFEFKMERLYDGNKTMKEMLESYGSTVSTFDSSTTNQEELDSSLQYILDLQTMASGDAVDDSNNKAGITTEEALSLEIDLNKLHYDTKDLLGGGGFADVYSGTYESMPVAIKCLKIDKRELTSLTKEEIQRDAKMIASETLIAHQCSVHSHIVQVFGYHLSLKESERHLLECPLIVMELMSCTLYDELHYRGKDKPALSYLRLLKLLQGIAGALEFIHYRGIVHHDIKPLNILLNADRTQAKLADFGEAKTKGLNTTRVKLSTILMTSSVGGHGAAGAAAGTVAYQAPEILTEQVTESSRVCEMYSFGVTVWEALTGDIPHKGKKESSIAILALTKKDQPMLVLPNSPKQELDKDNQRAFFRLRAVAEPCLSRNREMRLTAYQVVREWNKVKSTPTISLPSSSLPPVNEKKKLVKPKRASLDPPTTDPAAHDDDEDDFSSEDLEMGSMSHYPHIGIPAAVKEPSSDADADVTEPGGVITDQDPTTEGTEAPDKANRRKLCYGIAVVVAIGVIIAIIAAVSGQESPTSPTTSPDFSPTSSAFSPTPPPTSHPVFSSSSSPSWGSVYSTASPGEYSPLTPGEYGTPSPSGRRRVLKRSGKHDVNGELEA